MRHEMMVRQERDGLVFEGLERGVFAISDEVLPYFLTLSQTGNLWPYFVAGVVPGEKGYGYSLVGIDEIPDWHPAKKYAGKL